MTIPQVARELKIEPTGLFTYAQEHNWERLRLQNSLAMNASQNEKRIEIAKRIDDRIVSTANIAIEKASNAYLELIDKISNLPVNPDEIPDDELEKDDQGNIRRKVKRSKLIEDKVFLLNQAMDGFMKMSQGAQTIGLVVAKTGLNPNSTSEDVQKLSKLNVLLLNIQSGKGEKALKHVTEAVNIDNKPANE